MTYPNGRVLTSNYAAGIDSTISRLSSLSDSTGTLEKQRKDRHRKAKESKERTGTAIDKGDDFVKIWRLIRFFMQR